MIKKSTKLYLDMKICYHHMKRWNPLPPFTFGFFPRKLWYCKRRTRWTFSSSCFRYGKIISCLALLWTYAIQFLPPKLCLWSSSIPFVFPRPPLHYWPCPVGYHSCGWRGLSSILIWEVFLTKHNCMRNKGDFELIGYLFILERLFRYPTLYLRFFRINTSGIVIKFR